MCLPRSPASAQVCLTCAHSFGTATELLNHLRLLFSMRWVPTSPQWAPRPAPRNVALEVPSYVPAVRTPFYGLGAEEMVQLGRRVQVCEDGRPARRQPSVLSPMNPSLLTRARFRGDPSCGSS